MKRVLLTIAICAIYFMLMVQNTNATTIVWDLQSTYGISQSGIASTITDARNHFLSFPNDTIIVEITAGTYIIGGNGSYGINLTAGLAPGPYGRLIFQGAGMNQTTLVFIDMAQDMIHGQNVYQLEFRDMHMTRSSYTVTQGTVVSVSAGEIVIDIAPGFPTPLALYNASSSSGRYLRRYTNSLTDPQVIQTNNTQESWGWRNSAPIYPELVTGNQWRIFLNSSTKVLSNYNVGDYVGIKSKHEGGTYWFNVGNDLVFKNIKWTHSSRGLVRGGFSNVELIGCRIERGAPINGQMPCLSTPSGGPQMNQYASTGNPVSTNMVVEDCFIDSPGDDCVAFFNVDGGVVKNCTLRNSFARGIMAVDEGADICLANTQVQNSPIDIEHIAGGTTEFWSVADAIAYAGIFNDSCASTSQSNANVSFAFDEASGATEVINTGTETDVYAQINLSGGTITPGVSDATKGQVLYSSTNNDGNILLKDAGGNYSGPTGGAARTYTFWIKLNMLQFQTILYSGDSTAGGGFIIQMQPNGVVRITDGNGNYVKMSDMPLSAGQWTHVAVVVPQGANIQDIQLYKDAAASNENFAGANNVVSTGAGTVQLMSQLAGYMSDFRYYDYALTATQIQDIYNGVGDSVNVTGVTLSPTSATLQSAGTTQLTATVAPVDATDPSVTWSSSNPSVATVNANGLVTAVAIGTATVTATTNDGGFTATTAVTVTSDSNVSFAFDEASGATEVINTGTETDVYAQINLSGGTITPGVSDATKGQVLYSSTNNDGNILLKDAGGNYSGPTGGAARTYTFWIKLNMLQFQTILFSGDGTAGGDFIIQIQPNGVVRVTDGNDNYVKMGDLPLSAGQWTHVAVVVPQGANIQDIQLYKDAAALNENFAGANNVVSTGAGTVQLMPQLAGYTSDFRYYDYALTATQIQDIYNGAYIIKSLILPNINNDRANSINVFPNPTNGILNIDMDLVHSNAVANIVDLQGRVLITNQLQDVNNELDLSTLAQGIYILYIKEGSNVIKKQKIVRVK